MISLILLTEGWSMERERQDNLGCQYSGSIFVSGANSTPTCRCCRSCHRFCNFLPGSADGQIKLMETSNSTGIAPFEYWITLDGQDTVSTDIHGKIVTKDVFVTWPDCFRHLPPLYQRCNGCFNVSMPRLKLLIRTR